MKLEFSRQFFEKYSNIKFCENPSSGSCVVPCGRTNITNLIVAFRNFANAPKMLECTAMWKVRHSPVIQSRCLCIHGRLEADLFVCDSKRQRQIAVVLHFEKLSDFSDLPMTLIARTITELRHYSRSISCSMTCRIWHIA
jgi:hypothetical protein